MIDTLLLVISEEKQEQKAFIEEISRTAPIKYLHKYLVTKRLTSLNYSVFKGKLNSIWFDLLDNRQLIKEGKEIEDTQQELVIKDIQGACKLF